MKKFILVFTVAAVLAALTSPVASPIGYSPGPLHVSPAWTLAKGRLLFASHSRAFFKDEVTTAADGSKSGVTYWDIQGDIGLVYGFSSNLELGISQIVYQDNHKGGNGYNLPDDLYLTAKLGSFGTAKSNLRFGVKVDVKIPVADYHNLPLEPYTANRIGLGFMGLFSIVTEPLFPDSDVNFNGNIGVYNHNDLGVRQTKDEKDPVVAEKDTKEIVWGLSASKMMKEFGIFAELYGRAFINQPPITAYTRESSMYFAPGVVYSHKSNFSLKASLDIRLLGNSDQTVYGIENGSYVDKPWQTVPNLPSWRISVGGSYALNLGGSKEPSMLARQQQMREATGGAQIDQKIYDELAKERQRTESAEEELERIRAERQRMEQLLERLRNILEYPSQGQSEENDDSKKEPE